MKTTLLLIAPSLFTGCPEFSPALITYGTTDLMTTGSQADFPLSILRLVRQE